MAPLKPCPLWGGGTLVRNTIDYAEIDNPRSGGRYRIVDIVEARFAATRTDELAAKLTSWIFDQHRMGEPSPLITSSVLAAVQQRPRLAISEQMRRFFLLLLHRQFRANSRLKQAGVIDATYTKDQTDMLVWMECENDRERADIVRLLHLDGLVNSTGEYITLTPAGVRKLEEVQNSQVESNQVFVAMWFDPSMESAYENGFRKAIEAAGYRSLRIDKKEHNNKIDDEIVAEIKRSKFVVADFTSGKLKLGKKQQVIARGGVYFEAGLAMGLGIPVIWCCHEDLIGDVHFDTRQFSHVMWNSPADLEQRLLNRIRAVIANRA